MSSPIETNLKTADDLAKLLELNPGIIIIKLGATWCNPCKKIEPVVSSWLNKLQHDQIQRVVLDIDECIDLYGFLKKKRVVRGVPTLLAYYKENTHYVPDDMSFGSDENETNAFFVRCVEAVKSL
jgi:thiol-disulfide isomerase/thioredoxin